jgi:hypothetical protein
MSNLCIIVLSITASVLPVALGKNQSHPIKYNGMSYNLTTSLSPFFCRPPSQLLNILDVMLCIFQGLNMTLVPGLS